MNQDEFARRVVGILTQQLEDLPESTTSLLARARQRALKSNGGRTRKRDLFADWIASHRLVLQMAMPVVFLALVGASILLMQNDDSQEPFDVDTALIGDELPIHAYTDPGFDTWLRHSSHEDSR